MFNFIKFFLVLFILGFVSTLASAQKKSTYKMGETTYLVGEYYKKSSYPKVQRSSANRNEFLRSKGYSKTPTGCEVDHIVPLSSGGTDSPYNMQFITKEQHQSKTAFERSTKRKSSRSKIW